MTDTSGAAPVAAPPLPPVPHIGAFVLETLTLGMYGEPRHTLREYVQNAFDSIQLALRNNWMTERGRVDVTLSPDVISIKDNGTGIPAAQAWSTLTSIGASKKDRLRDAGFRGIGRLAGMAYCEQLVFRTRFSGEDQITEVTFDCVKLLKAMSPDEGGDVELAKLLQGAISSTSNPAPVDADAHFFEVRMVDLVNAPAKITEPQQVRDYLSETSPVGYSPSWEEGARIDSGYHAYFGTGVQTIDLFVTVDGNTQQIFKPYGDTYEHSKGQTKLKDIRFESGPDDSYWGWVGSLEEVVAVTDNKSRGLRARVRNIQVDGTELFHELFTAVSPSYGRLANYYVGEIHINPTKIVPNARRDGFEETKEWIRLKRDLSEDVCGPLAREIYQQSASQQVDVAKIVDDITKLEERAGRLVENSRASYDQVIDLMAAAKRLRKKAVTSLKTVQDVSAASEDETAAPAAPSLRDAVQTVESVEFQTTALLGRVLGDDGKLEGLRARIRTELLQDLLDIVKNYVDPQTFQRIRRDLSPGSPG